MAYFHYSKITLDILSKASLGLVYVVYSVLIHFEDLKALLYLKCVKFYEL